MTLNSVCSYLAMSTSYFSSIFKNYTGETFIEALTRKRVEKAKFLLENTSRKNYEIACDVGYSDPHYFSNIFKKATGYDADRVCQKGAEVMGGEKKSPLRMLSRFRTIRGAMIFSYMAITLLALLIFLLFSLNYTERTILENSESYTIQLVEQVNGDIDSYISYMENIMEIVTNNPELSDYLFDRMEHIMMRERIQEQFVTLLDARSDICNIAVFAKNGRTLINRGTDTRNPYVDLASMPWYQDTMEAEGCSDCP